MAVSPTIEEYLEAIYLMNASAGQALGARLADVLKVSPPTVTETVKRMQRDGYVEVSADKAISLTPMGQDLAEALLRRHALSERLLTDLLGMDWHMAHAEACKLEHAISQSVEERLAAVLGNPTTCPHGNPIPGAAEPASDADGQARDEALKLSQAIAGQKVSILRVTEEAEVDGDLLAHFDRHGLRPGSLLRVIEVLPVNGTITVEIDGRQVALGTQVAERLWVAPEQ